MAQSEHVKTAMAELVISERFECLERLVVNGAELSNGSMKQKGRKIIKEFIF